MDQPRLAYLASEYPAISHTFIFREVQALRRNGFDVRTVSIRAPEHIDRMTQEERAEADATLYIKPMGPVRALWENIVLKTFTLPRYIAMYFFAMGFAWRGRMGFVRAFAYFMEAGILVKWMRKNGIAHVHVHFANPAATVALIASHFKGIEFSVSMHGPDEFYNIESDLIREKTADARFVRCISHYCRSQALRVLPVEQWEKCRVARLGVDQERFCPRPDPQNATPEILCVGRLVPAKGQHVLLQACSALRTKGVAFHLTLVGDGPDRARLEHHAAELGISDAVTFAGAVGQGDIHAYYDRADIFALASFAEGLPVVLMEAMAKGIPCVATSITGIPELIEHSVNGLLAPASDSEAFAHCLELLLTDRQLRGWLGGKGRERVEIDYNLESNCRSLVQLFRESL